MKEHEHRCVAAGRKTRIDGANTVPVLLSTTVCCNDMFQFGQFITWEWGAAENRDHLGCSTSPKWS